MNNLHVKNRDEIERIKTSYQKRDVTLKPGLYSYFNPGSLYMLQERERVFLDLLKKHNIKPLENKKILEVGCGSGAWLRSFMNYGATPENINGVELLKKSVERAKLLSPNLNIQQGNCEQLTFEDESFDIVFASTLFTSILDMNVKQNIARNMHRVLKRNGHIIWYDFRYNNPKNKDVKGIEKQEIISLFPDCCFDFKKVTLAPPIARLLAPVSWLLCYVLEKLPFLLTHYFVIITKK